MNAALILVIRLYQSFLSPIIPFNRCRFVPSCSEYSIEAITKHGAVKGVFISLRRILRCRPLYKGSIFDPVP